MFFSPCRKSVNLTVPDSYLLENITRIFFFSPRLEMGAGFRTQMKVKVNHAVWCATNSNKGNATNLTKHWCTFRSSKFFPKFILSFPGVKLCLFSLIKINIQLENKLSFLKVTRKKKHRKRKETVVLEEHTVPSAVKALRHKSKTNKKP